MYNQRKHTFAQNKNQEPNEYQTLTKRQSYATELGIIKPHQKKHLRRWQYKFPTSSQD